MHCAAPKRSRKGLHMSDDIVAAHLAAALIQAGSQKLDAKTAATFISIAWRLSAQKDKTV
jgi:hypothetical protein